MAKASPAPARRMQFPAFMNSSNSVALAQRLEAAEVAVHRAYAGLDGSPETWTVLYSAKRSYREAEADAVVLLGAQAALELVTSHLTGHLQQPELRLVG